jgi:hypothetical protein
MSVLWQLDADHSIKLERLVLVAHIDCRGRSVNA